MKSKILIGETAEEYYLNNREQLQHNNDSRISETNSCTYYCNGINLVFSVFGYFVTSCSYCWYPLRCAMERWRRGGDSV